MAYTFTHAASNSDHLTVTSLQTFPSKLSLAAWVNIPATVSASNANTLFSIATNVGGDQRNFSLDYRNFGSIGLDIAWTTSAAVYVEYYKVVTLSTNTWVHLCVTIDWTTNPDTVQLYIDGVAQNPSLTGSNNSTPQTASMSCMIGALVGKFHGWGGSIAELTLWEDALTAADAAMLAQGYSAKIIHQASQVFYAPLIRELVDLRRVAAIAAGSPSGAVAAHSPIRNP